MDHEVMPVVENRMGLMKVGFVGLGKLGLPIAQAIAKVHDLMGYDIEPREGVPIGTLEEVCDHAEILFVAVQTPHEPRYEGITRLPAKRVDFDYSYLHRALRDIEFRLSRPKIVVIISTCLPGNVERLTANLNRCRVVYNPFFIAMGTEVGDFLDPEFILAGSSDEEALDVLQTFYRTFISAEMVRMSIPEAELTKVAYNTFISTKLAFVNTLLEICDKMSLDVDVVTSALCKADRRIISTRYMRAGMGDGGACHPRDNIALSWLSRELDLGFDFFEAIMMQRQKQAEWLANMMNGWDLPKAILGIEFKKESPLTVGSHGLLVGDFLGLGKNKLFRKHEPLPDEAHVFLIGMNHDRYAKEKFPLGSVVIDPWRYIPAQAGVQVIPVGGY